MGALSNFLKGATTPGIINPNLTPEAADNFISAIVDQSKLLKMLTLEVTNKNRKELSVIDIAKRQLIRVAEGSLPEAAHIKTPTVTPVVLDCKPVNLFVDLTYSAIDDNKHRPNFTETILQSFAARFANDLEDLALNGLAEGNETETTFLNLNKGFIKLAKDSNKTQKHDVNDLSEYLSNLKAIVSKQDSRFLSDSVLIMNPADYDGYVFEIGQEPSGVAYLLSGDAPRFMGYPIVTSAFMPKGEILFTPLKNLAVGISRQIQRTVVDNPRKRALEYTFIMSVDFQIIIPEAVVIGYDITTP